MARTHFDGFEVTSAEVSGGQNTSIHLNGEEAVKLPADLDFASTDIVRNGQDLILRDGDGTEVTVHNYFNTDPAPSLLSASGHQSLSPQLVQSFVQHDGDIRMANAATATDTSPIGEINEIVGDAKIIRTDGTEEKVTLGMPVFEGDIVETEGNGAVNMVFIDESSFAVSENARIAIDEFVFDPATEAGAQDFSILRGVFMYTSGLIGRENPDSVDIETPVGSIGIRGTIIGGKIDPVGESQITVIEGAIVVRNGGGELLLSVQYDTVKLAGFDTPMSHIGALRVNDVANDYGAVKEVSAGLFSTFQDQMHEQGPSNGLDEKSSEGEQATENNTQTDEALNADTQTENQLDLKSITDGKEKNDGNLRDKDDTGLNKQEDHSLNNDQLHFIQRDDLPPVHFIAGGNVNENAGAGTVVGTIGLVAPVDYDVSYALANNMGGLFSIDAKTGVITLNHSAPDYETSASKSLHLNVQVTRGDDNSTHNFNVAVKLNDVNEIATVNLVGSADILDEANDGLSGDVAVQTINVVDPDTTPAFRHMNFTVSDSRFTVKQINGEYKLVAKSGAKFDFENETSVTVSIQPSDGIHAYDPLTTTVNIGDVIDERPTDILIDNTNIVENTAGVVVGTLTAVDADANDTHTYTIINDPDNLFTINGDKLVLRHNANVNFEAKDSHSVTIRVTDSNGLSIDKTLTIDVTDVNEAAQISFSTKLTLNENDNGLDVDTVVQTIHVNDPDTNPAFRNISFTTSDDRFVVIEEAGQYKLVAKQGEIFDYETEQTVEVTITASDGVNNYPPLTTVINIGNLFDEAPTAIHLSNTTVNENDFGAVIGTLTTTDADINDEFTYTIKGDTADLFTVVNGQLVLKPGKAADFETASSHSITITVTDKGGNVYDQDFTIVVNDVNDKAVFTINPTAALDETVDDTVLAQDAVVTVIGFTDQDTKSEFRDHSFSVSDNRFEVRFNSQSGNYELIAKAGSSFDHETADSIAVTIIPSDGVNNYDDLTVNITINDLNEAPTEIFLDHDSVDENAPGAAVGTLTATDPDVADSYSFQIVGGHDVFVIDGNLLRIRSGVEADFEAQSSYTITIRVTDTGGLSYDKDFTININDVNELAVLDIDIADRLDNSATPRLLATLDEPGGILGKINVSDPENATFDADDFVLNGSRGQFFEVVEINGSYHLKFKDNFSLKMDKNIARIFDEDTGQFVADTTFNFNNPWNIGIDLKDGDLTASLDVQIVATNPQTTELLPDTGGTATIAEGGIVIGGKGNDTITLESEVDFRLIRGGEGYDVLRLDGYNTTSQNDIFDFTKGADSDNGMGLRSIEEIVLSVHQNDISNVLRIGIEDILVLLQTSDNGELRITSDFFSKASDRHTVEFMHEGQRISLKDYDEDGVAGVDFTENGTVSKDGHTYHVFTHDLGTVLLDTNIANAASGG